MKRVPLATLLAALALAPAAQAASSIEARLTPNESSVEITAVPTGTTHVGVAVMEDEARHGLKEGINLPLSQKVYTPPANDPVVDVVARDASNHAVGSWYSTVNGHRLVTVPGGQKEPPPEEEPPKEEPPEEPPVEPPHEEGPHPPVGFLPGLNAGYWGSSELADLGTLGVGVVRLDTPTSTTSWEGVTSSATGARLKVIADEAGPYSSSGVSGVNRQSYIERDIKLVRSSPGLFAVETLNEPGGNWFWGSSSESTANREAYARLVIAVHEALVREFGAARPLQLCSFDGGHDSSNAWGLAWSKVPGALAACDAVTSHPYGGHGANAIEGNRALVKQAHEASGRPVFVTEVGFPTKEATGDSNRYTETQQAWALYHFDEWAAATGYVPSVEFYGYRGDNYGIETHAGVKKRAFSALREFSRGEACTVCS